MNAATILQFVLAALQALPVVATTAEQLVAQIGTLKDQIALFVAQNRDPTADEWAALNAQLTAALTALNAART